MKSGIQSLDATCQATLLRCLSLSAWVTEDEVVPFFHEKESEVQKAPQDAIKHEQCKEHRLYAERKDTLVSMCWERSVEPSGMKYEIVERFPSALTEEKPRKPQLFDSTKKLPKSQRTLEDYPSATYSPLLSTMVLSHAG